MSASADEIDRQMKQSREHIDESLGAREQVRRYAGIAAVVLGVAVVAGAGVLIYRAMRGRTRKEHLKERLIDGLKGVPDSLRRSAPVEWAMRQVG